MRKIGIMGGTFNPIHLAHLILAEQAYEQLGLDKIIFMPTKNPPHKQNKNIVRDEYRTEMIALAIRDNPHFEMSYLELNREGLTYTADTLTILKEEHKEDKYYFIIGADSLYQMEDWMHPEIIFNLCHVVAAGRNHTTKQELQIQINHLKDKFHACIHLIDTPNMDISSHMLRKSIKAGTSIRYYVPDAVYQFILDHKLYQ